MELTTDQKLLRLNRFQVGCIIGVLEEKAARLEAAAKTYPRGYEGQQSRQDDVEDAHGCRALVAILRDKFPDIYSDEHDG